MRWTSAETMWVGTEFVDGFMELLKHQKQLNELD